MRTARLGVAGGGGGGGGGTVATMNAVTEESLDWNAAGAPPDGRKKGQNAA